MSQISWLRAIRAGFAVRTRHAAVGGIGQAHGYIAGCTLACSLALTPLALAAQEQPRSGQDVAALDWTPRDQLTEEQREQVPTYCSGAYVQPPLPGLAEADTANPAGGELPLRARSDQARYQLDRQAVLTGNVEITQGNLRVTSDSALYDQQAGAVALSGPIFSRGNGFALSGSGAQYDVDTGVMRLNTANFLLYPSAMRGTADQLVRQTETTFAIEQGRLTTCEPGNNAWSLVASDIFLNRETGVGEATHVRLEVKDTPVFYWPYLTFPIDDRRKSGLLYPSFGTSNTGRGLYAAVPYYFNLAPNYDATLTPQYIHGRGLHTELEGRYLSRFGASVLALGYLADDDEFGREFPDADTERWGLDFNTVATLGPGWTGLIDYAAVSDDEYLSDLNRTLEISEATHLLRAGQLSYTDSDRYFEAILSGYQTLDEDISRASRPYYQLPELVYAQTVGDDLEFNWESQYTYFWRDNEGLTGLEQAIGSRFRVTPEVALDLREIWGFTRPSVLLDHTHYALEDYDQGSGNFSRTVPFFQWDNGLYFDRQFEFFGADFNQSLEPRLYYVWSPAKDQDHIPDFDTSLTSFYFSQLFQRDRYVGGDRVGDNNRLTAAVTTRFNSLETGTERARMSIGQIYYYDEREVGLGTAGTETRSDSALAGELALRPLDGLEARVSGLWDARDYSTEQGRSELIFHSEDYRWLLNLGHTYDDDELEQSDVGAVFPVSRHISAVGRWVYDRVDDRTVGTLAGFEYASCCWSVQLVAQKYLRSNEEIDNRILFQVQLTGLGGGGSAAGEISEAVFGYEERQRRREQMTPAFGRF
ncbi:LPS-assembly protein LptD [Hydrocarboniclastica marina]|uniref:LPS-assembly protein LptD n=1 Tax=Hydrocarboniclastica marina TaxID=2259620 RepID=UPI001FE34336|nr:LPS-assembly protein LptD [Hydrocarboniclastica marina]